MAYTRGTAFLPYSAALQCTPPEKLPCSPPVTTQRYLRHSVPCLPGQIYMYGGRTGRLPSEVYDSKSYQELNVKGMALRSQLLTGWEVSAAKQDQPIRRAPVRLSHR